MGHLARIALTASLLLVVALIVVAPAGGAATGRGGQPPDPGEAVAGGGACLLVPVDLEELARGAERIVLSRVGRQVPRRDTATGVIWTDVTLDVEETWKGTAEPRVGLTEPGGVLDGIGLTVCPSVHYRTGERVVVFVHRDALGQTRTLGIAQGCFVVTRGERVVLDGPAGRAARLAFGTAQGDVALDIFRRRVSALAGAGGEGR